MDGSMDWLILKCFIFHTLGRVMHAMNGLDVVPFRPTLSLARLHLKNQRPTYEWANDYDNNEWERKNKQKHKEKVETKRWAKFVRTVHVLNAIDQKFPSLVSLPSITIQQSIFLCAALCHILIDNRKHRRQTNHIQALYLYSQCAHTHTHTRPHERISNIITFISTLCMTFVSHTHTSTPLAKEEKEMKWRKEKRDTIHYAVVSTVNQHAGWNKREKPPIYL